MMDVTFAPRAARVDEYWDIRALLADLAKVRDARHEEADRLSQQLQRNRALGEAIGLVMGTYKLGDQAAAEVIAALAAEQGVSEHEVALDIIAQHRERTATAPE